MDKLNNKISFDTEETQCEDYDGADFFCPRCGSIVIVDHGTVVCEVCSWSISGEELKKYLDLEESVNVSIK